MQALQSYTQAIKSALQVALCLREFPSETVEKQTKPEIEIHNFTKKSKPSHIVLNNIVIARNEKEKCLIEPSINSVRVSFTFKKNDEMDMLINKKFGKFFTTKAELFEILRRKPIEKYDFSFLITSAHLEKFDKDKLINFLIEVNKKIS